MGGGSSGGSGSSGAVSSSTISGTSFNNLGPSPTSAIAPSMAIPGSGTTSLTGRSTTGTTGSSTPVPTSYNPWGPYYLNAYQPGLGTSLTGTQGRSTNTSSGVFGQPLYSLLTTTTTGTNTASTANSQSQANGFTTLGLSKAPSYVTALSDDFVVSRPSGGLLQKELRAILERSSALKGQGAIELTVKGSEVILKGQVNKDQQRRLAEGLVRMTPGVSDVRNDLQVTAAKSK